MMGQRYEHGYPFWNTDARAIDVVARVSGVNFGSVEKVFAALDALQHGLGWDIRNAVSISNCPIAQVSRDRTMGERRMRASDEQISLLLRHLNRVPLEATYILQLDSRFQPNGTPMKGNQLKANCTPPAHSGEV